MFREENGLHLLFFSPAWLGLCHWWLLTLPPPRLKASSARAHWKHRHAASSQEVWASCLESQPGPAANPVRPGVRCPSSDPASCATGFLQRTNSLEEKSRLVSAFKERQSSKNLLSCENSDRDGRFRRTETDFSNLFARGIPHPHPTPSASQ